MRTLLVALLAIVPATVCGQTSDSVTPRPVAPVVVGGACPFECCRYGAWTLSTPAEVRARPSSKAPRLARLTRGSAVNADSGIVIVTRLGVVVVRRPYRDPAMNVHYVPGDTLVLLDYLGEGFWNEWSRGRTQQVSESWDRAPGGDAQLLVEQESEWWALVTWRDATREHRGWIDMRNVGVDGADACA